nr:uncharacterized protein LOC113739159 [Coffea arabica]
MSQEGNMPEPSETDMSLKLVLQALQKQAERHEIVMTQISDRLAAIEMRDLYNRLQRLTQGSNSVDEYHKQMEVAMIRANVQEDPEATMARFLNGLNPEIRKKVEFQDHFELQQMVSYAKKVEKQALPLKTPSDRTTTSSSTPWKRNQLPTSSAWPRQGRPWEYDRQADHIGLTNKYEFIMDNLKITLSPLTPTQVYEEQLHLRKVREKRQLREAKKKPNVPEDEEKKKVEAELSEREKSSGKRLSEAEGLKVKKKSFYTSVREIDRVLNAQSLLIVLMYREADYSSFYTLGIIDSLPSTIYSLLQEFKDVFPEELPKGLPPIRFILVPKKEGIWRMCTDCRAINKITVKYRHPIPSKSLEEHLRLVLSALRENRLFVNMEKCVFCTSEVNFLGYIVGANGISVDPVKVKAIMEWPTPTNMSQVRSFHGLASFDRRFVKDFSTIAAHLNEIVKKNVGFQWGKEQEESFNKFRNLLTSAPILALPNFDLMFEVECDASEIGIGAVLHQNNRPLAYFSEKLSGRALNYPTYDKELFLLIIVDSIID